MGTFIVGVALGAVIVGGTGYYYPPYIYRPVYGYPIYHPHAVTYGYGAYYNLTPELTAQLEGYILFKHRSDELPVTVK
jgi:hypothetical protein